MAENLITFLEPIRDKRAYYEDHPEQVEEIMVAGSEKASQTARQTMQEVREAVKI